MAAMWRWRGAWRSRVSSTVRGGGCGSLQLIPGSTTTASGTTLSTATYTTSSDPVGERPLPALEVEENAEELVKTREHIRDLVEEFRAGANGNVTAPDRWLSELYVAWLLRLAELDASAATIFVSRQLQHLAQSWILALWVINTSIWGCFSGFYSQEEATVAPPAASELVQFVEATLLKMLTFINAIVAPLNLDDSSGQQHIVPSIEGAAEKLRALLDVRDALSLASEQIMESFRSSPDMQSTRITDDMGGLLSAELGKLDQAVWDTVDQIRAAVMSSLADDDDDSCSCGTTKTPQTSPDIHKVTRSVISCISVLSTYASVDPIISTLIMKMVRSLEEKLARVSQSFADQSLGFLFLINNSYFIWQKLHASWFLHDGTHKIDRYIQSYLQVSWAPVLKCLHNPAVHCFTRNSPLPKFEYKFQTTYDAQKLCKVPDPELRKRLRKAIIEKVASGFTKYLEDNNSITQRVTPHEMEEMLQELFEG